MASRFKQNSAILFDLDGTLLDTAPDLTAAVNHARETLMARSPLSVDELRPIVAQGTRAMVDYATAGDTSISVREEFREQMLAYYANHLADFTAPFDGISEILDYLDSRQRPWAVVTNKLSEYALPILDSLNLSARAGSIVCADMVDKPKPAPDALLLAAKQLNLAPNTCAYVGDSRGDMQAAQQAGMLAIAAEWGYLPTDDAIDDWPFDLSFADPHALSEWISQ